MADQQSIDYIRNGLDSGYAMESLKRALLEQGWPVAEVEEAARLAQAQAQPQQAGAGPAEKMGIVKKTRMILRSPTAFFTAAKQDHIGDALKYYAIFLLIPTAIIAAFAVALPSILFSAISPLSPQMSGGAALMPLLAGLMTTMMMILVVAFYFISLIATFIIAGIYHLIALLFGARKSYSETYKTITYASTPFLLIGWVYLPLMLVNMYASLVAMIAIAIWALIIMIKGLSVMQEISGKRAAAIILLPVIIIGGIALVLSIMSWFYLGNFLTQNTGNSFNIPPGGAYCSNGRIGVTVENIGEGDIAYGDWVVKNVKDSLGQTVGTLSVLGVPANGTRTFTSNCANACAAGSYVVKLATGYDIKTVTVTCT